VEGIMFERLCQERQYLQNVSPRTLDWYRESFKWLGTESPTESELKDFVLRMRTAELKPTSCNKLSGYASTPGLSKGCCQRQSGHQVQRITG
jgi:hypothetical protein